MKAIKTTPGSWITGIERATRVRNLLVLAAVFAVGITGALALAAGTMIKSEVTIGGTNGDYHGQVVSKERSCKKNRTVEVYKMVGSTPKPSQDRRIGSDTTDNQGKWDIGNSGYKHGRFYALVARSEVLRSAAHRADRCTGARSKVIKR